MVQVLAQKMEQLFKSKGYVWYTEPYKLNIVAVRNSSRVPNTFDDYLYLVYKVNTNTWEIKQWVITTDPGSRSLKTPRTSKGTAILVEGQYVNTHKVDLHQGNYKALCQRLGPVKVYRDANRDNKLDLNPKTIVSGNFGINIHKAGWDSTTVEDWSAGCMVFKRSRDFTDFMSIVNKSAKLKGNKFTITLIKDTDI